MVLGGKQDFECQGEWQGEEVLLRALGSTVSIRGGQDQAQPGGRLMNSTWLGEKPVDEEVDSERSRALHVVSQHTHSNAGI